MNFDLHTHSTASDGLLAPAQLAERAAARGVTTLALTDHDELSGLAEAGAAARQAGITFINGVEISAGWSGEGCDEAISVHILGLGVDPDHEGLKNALTEVRQSRLERARRIGDSLAEADVPDALQGALAHAGNPMLVSRAHFARYLAAAGHARDMKSVFDHYLVPGKPGYVPHDWANPREAVAWIRAAGGVAVLAHPGRYGLTRAAMRELLGYFRDCGGTGVEVLSGSHTPEQWREYAMLAGEFGLAASRGSDFHGPRESRTDLGALPELPSGVTPIWNQL